jgi:FlaA1/EpsC-like NDP-sugar epimerase
MEEVVRRLLQGPRRNRVGIYIVVDAVLAITAVRLAIALRLEGHSTEFLVSAPWIYPVAVAATTLVFHQFGLYRSPLRFASAALFYRVAMAGTVASSVIIAAVLLLHETVVPLGALIILWGLIIVLPGVVRMLIRDGNLRRRNTGLPASVRSTAWVGVPACRIA